MFNLLENHYIQGWIGGNDNAALAFAISHTKCQNEKFFEDMEEFFVWNAAEFL
jgi:hypothetical protein